MAITSTAASPTVVRTAAATVTPAVTTAVANATRGNAAIPTGYSSTPATTSAGTSTATSLRTAAAQVSAGVPIATTTNGVLKVGNQAVTTAQQGVAALGSINNFITSTAGTPQSTGVQSDVKDAISALTAYAQGKMDNVKANIKALMSSEGGADSQLNAAKLQEYSQELATFESMMQMAAKMQDQQDQAIKIWVRP